MMSPANAIIRGTNQTGQRRANALAPAIGGTPMTAVAYAPRFWAKVDRRSPAECWQWQANASPNGYGRFYRDGRQHGAHRVAYELNVGPIPEGLTIDHLCKNTRCVNPNHLEAVPAAVNMLRGDSPCARNARKTHCKHGHEFTPENTRLSSRGRACLTCEKEALKRRRRAAGVRPRRTFSDEEIQQIQAETGTYQETADRFGIALTTAWVIRNRERP
jgi:hypothetical protein